MVDISHRVGVLAPPAKVHEALATVDGLAGWWTSDTSGADGTLRFRFGEGRGFDMRVLAAGPERVEWEVVDGPDEWIGTHIRFDLEVDGDWTLVSFTHAGWAEVVPFLRHCSTKWATFLHSLQQFVESGSGRPHPHDVRVDNWD